MKTHKILIFIIIDVVTLAFGSCIFVIGTLACLCSERYNKEDAGVAMVGCFMVVLGLLINYWRKNYFNGN